jgi:Short C-terminal domain
VRQKQLKAQRQAALRAPAAPTADIVGQLKDLKALQDDGVLSPDEFQAAKRRVLGS